jgi:hypothetical protein
MLRLAMVSERALHGLGLMLLVLTTAISGQKVDGFGTVPESGTLTVWVVLHNPNPRPRSRVAVGGAPAVPQYQEKTMGEFGQTAGSVGQTAGSVGQTAGSFGQTAGSTGEPAGNTGQTAGSFGTTASSVGKNAGDAGQTVGSFGVSTSDLSAAAAAANTIRTGVVRHDSSWDNFERSVEGRFPQLQVRFYDVYDDELAARLEAVAGTPNAPDALVGRPLPSGWKPSNGTSVGQYGMVTRVLAVYHPQTEDDAAVQRPRSEPEAAVLDVGGRGPVAARAMYLWLLDEDERTLYRRSSADDAAAVAVAEQAFRGALGGDGVTLQVDATDGHIRDSFAVVALRAVELGQREFGVAYGLAVLRKAENGRWGLLQISPYLTRPMQRNGFDVLLKATLGKEESNPLGNESPKPLGISQAAPLDGDVRSPQPQLWWDNKGGASLQVVEWGLGDGPTNLFFVKDVNPHLRTAVVARFARAGGRYRWRVWSVGADGAMVLSPWRTMIVAGR